MPDYCLDTRRPSSSSNRLPINQVNDYPRRETRVSGHVETLLELHVVAYDTDVADHAAIRAHITACRAFADVESGADRLHFSTSLCRLQKFPEATILGASILSA